MMLQHFDALLDLENIFLKFFNIGDRTRAYPELIRQLLWHRAFRELSLVMLKFTKRSLQVEMLGGLCGLDNPIT